MTIHQSHPFPTPTDEARRFRGRLGGRVSLWVSGEAGLTVSSFMVVAGEPWRVVGALQPDADLTESLLGTGVAAVSLLREGMHGIADAFAGVVPAPGGPFRSGGWVETGWGRVPEGVDTWAGVRLESTTPCGWLTLTTCVVEQVEVGDDEAPLHHRRRRYVRL